MNPGGAMFNCRKVQEKILAYLDNEVSACERIRIEEHLARCEFCQKEAGFLRSTRSQITESLCKIALETEPSPAVWDRLATALAETSEPRALRRHARPLLSRGSRRLRRRLMSSKLRWVVVVFTVVVVAACGIAATPVARSAVADFFSSFLNSYRVEPMQIGYLPAGFDVVPVYRAISTGSDETGGKGNTEQERQQHILSEKALYRSGELFIFIQAEQDDGSPLPEGQTLRIDNHDAVLVPKVSGVVPVPVEILPEPDHPKATDPRYVLHYQDASALYWTAKSMWIQILSNLPVDEIRKIAEGLTLGTVEKAPVSP